jgi:predicted nucleic acid-binding protein
MALVLDTGPIVALLDASDPAHELCVAMVSELREDLVVPVAVAMEVDYWLLKLFGHEPWQTSGCTRRWISVFDASVIATCEELDESKVATLDRRDFAIVRPRHRDHLTLLPE